MIPEVDLEDESTEATNSRDTSESPEAQKVFLNPTTRDTLLTDLVNGSYNRDVIKASKGSSSNTKDTSADKQIVTTSQAQTTKPNMTVATRDPAIGFNRLNSV